MQSTKQEVSPYNQIYFFKQVFVNTTKYSNIFMFTIVKRQIVIGNSHRFFPEFITLTSPHSSLLGRQKFAGYNCTWVLVKQSFYNKDQFFIYEKCIIRSTLSNSNRMKKFYDYVGVIVLALWKIFLSNMENEDGRKHPHPPGSPPFSLSMHKSRGSKT